MTEYTTSSQAIRDYLSSKERTKQWIYNRIEPPDQCYSPTAAPSVFHDPDFVLPPASDAGSSHSTPPKMVLRYSDGREDEPIPYESIKRGGSKLRPRAKDRSSTLPTIDAPRSRSGSHTAPRVPEEIRILPSHAADAPRSAHSHVRSKSLPRNAYSQIQDPMPEMPPHHFAVGGPGPRPGPLVTFSQPPQPYHGPLDTGSHGRRHAPPPIVYAPSHHRPHPHYAPPAIYSHPPKMGPNGMIYSHSAPVHSSQHPQQYPTPYPSAVPSSHMSSVKEERRSKTPSGTSRRDRSQSRTGSRRHLTPASSVSSFKSDGSGSTYYVMPTGRQKVHVIHTPDTSASLHSHSNSQSHSPTSVRSGGSGGGSMKKPFFQRLLGFAEKRMRTASVSGESSHGSQISSHGGRRLQRRHSGGTGTSGRSRSVPPAE